MYIYSTYYVETYDLEGLQVVMMVLVDMIDLSKYVSNWSLQNCLPSLVL